MARPYANWVSQKYGLSQSKLVLSQPLPYCGSHLLSSNARQTRCKTSQKTSTFKNRDRVNIGEKQSTRSVCKGQVQVTALRRSTPCKKKEKKRLFSLFTKTRASRTKAPSHSTAEDPRMDSTSGVSRDQSVVPANPGTKGCCPTLEMPTRQRTSSGHQQPHRGWPVQHKFPRLGFMWAKSRR